MSEEELGRLSSAQAAAAAAAATRAAQENAARAAAAAAAMKAAQERAATAAAKAAQEREAGTVAAARAAATKAAGYAGYVQDQFNKYTADVNKTLATIDANISQYNSIAKEGNWDDYDWSKYVGTGGRTGKDQYIADMTYQKNIRPTIKSEYEANKANIKNFKSYNPKTQTLTFQTESERKTYQITPAQREAAFTEANKDLAAAIKSDKYVVTYTIDGKTDKKTFQTSQAANEFISSLPSAKADTSWIYTTPKGEQTIDTSYRPGIKGHGIADVLKPIQEYIRVLEKEAKYEPSLYHAVPPAKVSYEEMRARLAHISLSATVGAATSLPYIVAGTVGGPVVTGLIAAGMVASLANPDNRAAIGKYIREHPTEFTAGLIGALTAGVAVGEIKGAYNDFKQYLAKQQQYKIETALDKAIDDLAYREQQLGAKFPSDLKTDVNTPDWETYVSSKFVKGLTPQDVQALIKNQPNYNLRLYMDNQMLATTLDDLVDRYPKLMDPSIQPYTGPDLSSFLKAHPDLVARIPKTNMGVSPLLIAALAKVSQQGYVTEEEINAIIKQNNVILSDYKTVLKDVQVPWDKTSLKELSFIDVITLSSLTAAQTQAQTLTQTQAQAQAQIQEQIQNLSATQVQELIQSLDTVQLQEIVPFLTTTQITELTKKLPPILRSRFLKAIEEKKPKPSAEKDKFIVTFTDYGGRVEVLNVKADSFREAYLNARKIQRWHGLMHVLDIIKL